MASEQPLVQVENLSIGFTVEDTAIQAVDSISFELKHGESLGLVGESGCGKTVSAMSILKLLPMPPAHIESGRILFDGRDVLRLTPSELHAVRGREIGVIFQEPMTSLNPVKRIGEQVSEALTVHFPDTPPDELARRTAELLRVVGLPNPEHTAGLYPHKLSGGMRQRVIIAIAVACNPKLLIADEPTTALDVTIQAQIMELIRSLKDSYGMSLILITHNMGLVTTTCDRIIVMYAGRFAETASVGDLFREPLHPYTQGLMKSIPTLRSGSRELSSIKGSVPHPSEFLPGCRFAPRCPRCFDKCGTREPPPLFAYRKDHRVSCWLYEGKEDNGR
ncbi:MAG: ABC transporter ATP-binding protein [Spirochaetia bacterium]|jgi:oligopeptide/dipeptide ABC transporter ATP-binding protein